MFTIFAIQEFFRPKGRYREIIFFQKYKNKKLPYIYLNGGFFFKRENEFHYTTISIIYIPFYIDFCV